MNDAENENKNVEMTGEYHLYARYDTNFGYYFDDTKSIVSQPSFFLRVKKCERNDRLADSIAHLMNEMQKEDAHGNRGR